MKAFILGLLMAGTLALSVTLSQRVAADSSCDPRCPVPTPPTATVPAPGSGTSHGTQTPPSTATVPAGCGSTCR